MLIESALHQVCARPGLEAAAAVLVGGEPGHEHDRQVGEARRGAHCLGQPDPAQAGHLDVGEQELGAGFFEEPERLLAVARHHDLVAGGLEDALLQHPGRRRVVGEEHPALALRRLLRRGQQARRARPRLSEELHDIEEERERAVGEQGRAGDVGEPPQPAAEGLDDRLLLREDLVDEVRRAPGPEAQDHRGQVRPRRGPLAQAPQAPQHLGEQDQGNRPPVELEDGLPREVPQLACREADDALDEGDRERQREAARADDQRPGAQERQRDRQREARARARRGRDLDAAVQARDLGADHVEPHAAAGDGGGRSPGGEPRLEHEAQHVRFGVGDGEAALKRPGPHRSWVDAPAVVGHRDLHLIVPQLRRDGDAPPGRLARGLALGGRLEPVVDGVAQEVEERVLERLDHRAVELDQRAGDRQLDALAQALGEVEGEAIQA